jgi:hypothetical protein
MKRDKNIPHNSDAPFDVAKGSSFKGGVKVFLRYLSRSEGIKREWW